MAGMGDTFFNFSATFRIVFYVNYDQLMSSFNVHLINYSVLLLLLFRLNAYYERHSGFRPLQHLLKYIGISFTTLSETKPKLKTFLHEKYFITIKITIILRYICLSDSHVMFY